MLKTWGNRVKIKNSDWFSSITWGLTILYWIFDFSVIIDGLCWRQGGIELKSKIAIDSHITWGITILHWGFGVSVIIGNHCWRHGGIELKSKIVIDSHLYLRTNHSRLDFWRFGYYLQPLLVTWRNRVKIKNSDWFWSITWRLTILHWFYDVSVIIGYHCWRQGGIELKSKIPIDSHLLLED